MLEPKPIHTPHTNTSEARIVLGGISFSLTSTDIETIDRFNNAMIKSPRNSSPDFLININYVPSLKGTVPGHGLGLGQKISEISGRVLYGDKSIQGCFQWSHGQVQVFFEESARPLTPPYLFSLVLSVFYVLNENRMEKEKDTLFLHAAGIVRNDNAYIFAGPSGSGKTTVSSLSNRNSTVINDECIQLDYVKGSYRVLNTPIKSEIYCLRKIEQKLKYIFFLTKSNGHSLRRVRGGETAIRLLDSLVYPANFSLNWIGTTSEKLRLVCNLANKVPCYEMCFAKDNHFWREIDKLTHGKF